MALEIEHPYIGDLRVRLTTPGGETVILHDRSGASADHLVRSYTSEDTPALAGLTGSQAEGDWVLQVADLAARDLGTLRRWSLAIGLEEAEQAAHGEATPGLTIPDHDATGVSSAIAITQSGMARGIKVGGRYHPHLYR